MIHSVETILNLSVAELIASILSILAFGISLSIALGLLLLRKNSIPLKLFKNGFCVVIGGGEDANDIENELKAKNVATLRQAKENSNVKSVFRRKFEFNEAFLRKIRFRSYRKNIMFFLASNDDGQNFNAAALIKNELSFKCDGSGQRVVKVLYKNIAKANLYRFTDGSFKFFSLDELAAKRFLADNPIDRFLPKSVIDKINGQYEKEKQLDAEQEPALENPPAVVSLEGKKRKGKEVKAETIASLSFLSKKEEKDSRIISNIYIGFSATSAEILEKTVCTDHFNTKLDIFVFDEKADILLPAYLNKLSELETENQKTSAKMAAIKVHYDALELYEKSLVQVREHDYSFIYISTGNELVNIETAVELREALLRESLTLKANIFVQVKNDTQMLNENFGSDEKLVFFGRFSDVFKELMSPPHNTLDTGYVR